MALESPLLFYAFQALKNEERDALSDIEKKDASSLDSVQTFPSEAVSISSFVQNAQHPLRSQSWFVTGIEWRAEPYRRLYYEYAAIHASSSVRSTPSIAIRVDRYGKLDVKVPWWHIRPIYLFANTKRVSTTILIRPTGDPIADPRAGTSVLKYTHWTHSIPPSVSTRAIGRDLERARIDACTGLNYGVRPYVSHDLDMDDKQIRLGRRWADSRGLQFVHADIARALAGAVDIRMACSIVEVLWTSILPSWLIRKRVQNNVDIRREYSRIVDKYRDDLRQLVHSLPDLSSETQNDILCSWGVNGTQKPLNVAIRLLGGSLSNHAFISPLESAATLDDVVSRFDTLSAILPRSGFAQGLCELYAKTLTARLPDKLWHAYAVSTPSSLTTESCAIRRRVRNSGLFWLWVGVLIQWIIALISLQKDSPISLWLTLAASYHSFHISLSEYRMEKMWDKIWNAYELGIIQGRGDIWEEPRTLSSSSRSKWSFWTMKWVRGYTELSLAVLN